MASLPFVICDVFTSRPLEGNQLAVFTDGPSVPESLLQPLAREMHFSETVFVYPPDAGADADFRIRIFTPEAELPFAGHPVLGSAFVLAAACEADEIRLQTGRGVIPIRLQREGPEVRFGWMTQPIPTALAMPEPEPLLRALGIEKAALPVEIYDNGVRHVYVGLGSENAVAQLLPDMAALARLMPSTGVNCIAGAGTRWKARMFGPGMGIPEDPATGSAAGPLAVHLARYERIAFGTEIEISQGAEIGRPSTLYARVRGGPDRIERVEVGGSAVVVARGAFSV
jgi:trans-2,3-dihydro-3-hydroxyanthranilate isomerase